MPSAVTLAPYVASLQAYDVDLGAPGVHRGLPSTTVTLVLPVDVPLRVSWSGREQVTGWSSVAGLHTRPAQVHHDGHQRGVQVALTTAGARALLGLPAGELADRLLTLEDLLGEAWLGLVRLPELLAGTAHHDRAAVVGRALAEALGRGDASAAPAAVTRALDLLARGARVDRVADEVGYSRRHLATLVRRETGLTPRQLRRVARLQRARGLLGHRPLVEVAARCGYADQAHLTREWSALAGCTPTTWLAEEFPFVQDVEPGPAPG